MKKLFIWHHRREAQWHNAQEALFNCLYSSQYKVAYHKSWKQWHLAQIERLTK